MENTLTGWAPLLLQRSSKSPQWREATWESLTVRNYITQAKAEDTMPQNLTITQTVGPVAVQVATTVTYV